MSLQQDDKKKFQLPIRDIFLAGACVAGFVVLRMVWNLAVGSPALPLFPSIGI